MRMRPFHAVLAGLTVIMALAGCATTPDLVAPSRIETRDVDRFFAIYDAAGGRPDAETLQREYLDRGSDGLKVLAGLRNVTGERMAANIAKNPQAYEDARACAETLPRVASRLDAALEKLVRIQPAASIPTVTIAVGRGSPVGVGAPDTGVQIGLEALCAATFLNPDVEDRFVHVIAHEYVHVQQPLEVTEPEAPTVLEVSLMEGVAEFVGELISGNVAYNWLPGSVAGRETEIETAFLKDIHSQDLSRWAYNSTPDAPGDLGYWVGYRIAKSYYEAATDKSQAIADMLAQTDADAFLAASGWSPGSLDAAS